MLNYRSGLIFLQGKIWRARFFEDRARFLMSGRCFLSFLNGKKGADDYNYCAYD